jgi:hypothetical protein
MTTPHPLDPARRDVLRNQLLATVDLLKRRRAADVAAGFIEDYVTMHWLEWNGGSLRLTTTGENMCKHLVSQLNRAAPELASGTRRTAAPAAP